MNIALTGRFRSGKDTVGKYLVERFGYTQFAFGDDLRNDFHRRYPEIPRDPKPRPGYQLHGQLMRRLVDEDIWVNRCFLRISSYLSDIPVSRPVVITDLRQPNEYDRCRREGFIIVRANCPDEIRIERARNAGDQFSEEDLRHETELHIDSYQVDFELDNSRDLDHLYGQIERMMMVLSTNESQVFGSDCPNGRCEFS